MRTVLLLALLTSHQLPAQAPPLWGSLQIGGHRVGYREMVLRDRSRAAIPVAGLGNPADGRQIRVRLWYPSGDGGTPMTYGDYVERLTSHFDAAPAPVTSRDAGWRDFMARSSGLGGDTVRLRRERASLESMRMAASADAPPAPGRFPLVLFPAWRPPASNAIMAEYLASHGYVVASHALAGSQDEDVEYFAPRGLEVIADDMAVVLNALDTLPGVDARTIATIGVGIAASGALAFQMRSPAVRAFISLEGGVTTAGEQYLVQRTPSFDVARVNVPFLAITAPHPSVDAARLGLYRYADRTVAHFPRMGEFWFLDFGMLERFSPGIIGTPPGNTVDGFTWGARIVRGFLDAHLRRDATSLDAALRSAPESLVVLSRMPAVPAAPSLAELKAMLRTDGVAALQRLVDARRATDSLPVSGDYFMNLDAWLSNNGRPPGERVQLAALRVRLYLGSARAQATLGGALARTDPDAARRAYARALDLMATDDDPTLDREMRQRIERAAATAGVTRGPSGG